MRVRQPQFLEPLPLAINNRIHPELLNKTLELTRAGRALVQIHEMCLDAALREKP